MVVFMFIESAVVVENQRFTTTTWKTLNEFTTLSTNPLLRNFLFKKEGIKEK